jgi:competence protein ComEC
MKINRLLFVSLFSILILGACKRAGELEIHFIDNKEVGCYLIRTPSGRAVLVDAGSLLSGYRVVQYLRKIGVKRLEHFVLTQPQAGQFAGCFFVMPLLEVGHVHDNGWDISRKKTSPWGDDLFSSYETLVRKDKRYTPLAAGDFFKVDGVTFRVLWPKRPFFRDYENANSIALLVEYGKFRCLLSSDITQDAEAELLKLTPDVRSDVWQVSHHGCADASSQEFLQAVSPRVSVLTATPELPSSRVIQRIERSGTRLYSLFKNGTVRVKVLKNGRYLILTER